MKDTLKVLSLASVALSLEFTHSHYEKQLPVYPSSPQMERETGLEPATLSLEG